MDGRSNIVLLCCLLPPLEPAWCDLASCSTFKSPRLTAGDLWPGAVGGTSSRLGGSLVEGGPRRLRGGGQLGLARAGWRAAWLMIALASCAKGGGRKGRECGLEGMEGTDGS